MWYRLMSWVPIWFPWRYTFWHTSVGQIAAFLVGKPSICGRTCGCSKATGCVGIGDGRW
jgi:hypothetical protein